MGVRGRSSSRHRWTCCSRRRTPVLGRACRFTQVASGTWAPKPPAQLAQIDIDAEELGRHYPLTCSVRGDARLTLKQLLGLLPRTRRTPWAPPRTPPTSWQLAGIDLLP